MDTQRILTIIDKEWHEVFKNRVVLFTVIFLPLIMTVMPLGILAVMGSLGGMNEDLPAQFSQMCQGQLSTMDCMQYYLMSQFLVMFMIMPLIIPIAIAAYSIVGEKTTRSLEPLLATPISTEELLTGKALAAALPAIAATWIGFFIFVAFLPLVGGSSDLVGMVLSPTWLVAIGVIGPLMAVASVNTAIIVSSRVNDPRAAEQISSVLIVPILALLFGQLSGFIILDLRVMLISTLFMLALDAALIYVGARLFQREKILTQWK